jgi:hypothetical protein
VKYAQGGVTGKTGQVVKVEVPVHGTPAPKAAPKAAPKKQAKPEATTGRTRMSIWCFGNPFLGAAPKVDPGVLDKIKEARVDDVSLVNTLAPPDSNWAPGGVVKDTGVSWSDGFMGLFKKMREEYLTNLVTACHDRGIQLMLGYCIGNSNDPKDAIGNAYAKNFTGWLAALSEDQVKAHARAVAAFVKQYKADGIGFDLEITSLGEGHRANLRTLYSTIASELQDVNGLVSYANAPFTSEGHVDGTPAMSGMRIQDFNLARDIPNLVARPMCYDTNALDYGLIQRSLDWALGGAGLKPSQLQLGLYACDPKPRGKGGTQATKEFIESQMQPKRVGMIHYQVPAGKWTGSKMDHGDAVSALAHVAEFEGLLNKG